MEKADRVLKGVPRGTVNQFHTAQQKKLFLLQHNKYVLVCVVRNAMWAYGPSNKEGRYDHPRDINCFVHAVVSLVLKNNLATVVVFYQARLIFL